MRMDSVLINRRRLLVGDIFTLPGDEMRRLHLVVGSEGIAKLLVRCASLGWYGYMDKDTGIVHGSRMGEELDVVAEIPDAVQMRECDLR